MADKRIEYMCTYCGKKEIRNTSMGRRDDRFRANVRESRVINRIHGR